MKGVWLSNCLIVAGNVLKDTVKVAKREPKCSERKKLEKRGLKGTWGGFGCLTVARYEISGKGRTPGKAPPRWLTKVLCCLSVTYRQPTMTPSSWGQGAVGRGVPRLLPVALPNTLAHLCIVFHYLLVFFSFPRIYCPLEGGFFYFGLFKKGRLFYTDRGKRERHEGSLFNLGDTEEKKSKEEVKRESPLPLPCQLETEPGKKWPQDEMGGKDEQDCWKLKREWRKWKKNG